MNRTAHIDLDRIDAKMSCLKASMNRQRLLGATCVLCFSACNGRPFLYATHAPVATRAEAVSIPGEGRFFRDRDITLFHQRFGTDCEEGAVHVVAYGGNAMPVQTMVEHVEETLQPWWKERCVEVWALNYPGFGPDQGRASVRAAASAARQAYRFVESKAGTSPVVFGYSFGGSLALHVAATATEAPSALIVERTPAIPRLILGRFGWWNLWLAAGPMALSLPRSLWARSNARRLEHVPALFVLGIKDAAAPPTNAFSIASAYAGPRRIVWADVEHTDPLPIEEPSIRAGLAWLLEHVEDQT